MKQLIIALAIGWSGIASAQISTIPTIPIDPRCGQIFCPPPPPNPCTVDPNLCKPKQVVPVQPQPVDRCWLPEGCPPKDKKDEFKCIDGIRYQKIKTPDGMWVWKPVLWPSGEPVRCETH